MPSDDDLTNEAELFTKQLLSGQGYERFLPEKFLPKYSSDALFVIHRMIKACVGIQLSVAVPPKFGIVSLLDMPQNIIILLIWRNYGDYVRMHDETAAEFKILHIPEVIDNSNGIICEGRSSDGAVCSNSESKAPDFEKKENVGTKTESKSSDTAQNILRNEKFDAKAPKEDDKASSVMSSHEAYQYWYAQEQAERSTPVLEPKQLQIKSEKDLRSEYQKSLCPHIDNLKSGDIEHTHPEQFFRFIEHKHQTRRVERFALDKVSVTKKNFKTLCAVFYDVKAAMNFRMKDIIRLFEDLGGSVTETTGSIDQIFIPVFGSSSTTLHVNHGSRSQKIGLNVAVGVRRVLTSFKIDPMDFKHVSSPEKQKEQYAKDEKLGQKIITAQ
jgi:hypothetical protein